MKIVNEDGSISYTGGHLARTSREPVQLRKGKTIKPLCGADNRNGGTCGQGAGARTAHKGVGRCWLHGGELQTVGVGALKNTLAENITFPGVKEEFERLSKDRDVFDLRDHIHLVEAMTVAILNKAKTTEDLGQAIKHLESASKIIKTLDEIEHARRYVIDVQGLNIIFAKIQEVIFRNIPDPHSRSLIARDLSGISIGGTGLQDRPSLESGTIIEGVAVEE